MENDDDLRMVESPHSLGAQDIDDINYGIDGDENRNGFDEDIQFEQAEQAAQQPPRALAQEQQIPVPQQNSRFRLNCINIFCTWPQCDADKNEVMAKIMAWKLVEWTVVAKEQHHETEGAHLHAVIHLKRRCDLHSTNLLDSFAGKHGDYKTCRSLKMSVIYVTKDNDYVANGIDVNSFCEEKKSAKSAIIAEMIKKDTPIEEIMEKESGFWMLHSKQIRLFKAEWEAIQQSKTLTGFTPVQMRNTMKSWETLIGIWLNGNINNKNRRLGQQQLYVWGKTGVGKTHFCVQLSKMVKTFWATSCEHFFDGLDDTYELLIMDEFHAQQTITFMNQLLDGQPMVLPQKGTQFHKKKNIPIIILSNYDLKDCYRKQYDENREHFDALHRRLAIVHVDGPMDLWPPQLQHQNAFRL